MLEDDASWKRIISIIFAVGIRPCTGAVLVLMFAMTLDLYVSGILAVMAMSLGTAITVSSLAIFAIYSRQAAIVLSQKSYGKGVENASLFISLLGGGIITLLGISLLIQSIATKHPLF